MFVNTERIEELNDEESKHFSDELDSKEASDAVKVVI